MPNEVLATEVLAPLPEVALSEPDYRAFCAGLDASAAAIKAAKLAGLIGFVQHRIESIVAPMRAQSPLPPEVAALVLMDDEAVEVARSHLVVVPRADEPELPIPAPAAGPQPAIALVHAAVVAQPEQEVTPPAEEVTP